MIRGLYKTDVCTITADKTIKEAATYMRDRNIGDVVVVESQGAGQGKMVKPLGILTDRDIVVNCVATDPSKIESTKISEVMSNTLTFVKEDTGLFETIRKMREAGVGRILVCDNNGALMGILTAQTIFDLLNDELHELGQIAKNKRPNTAAGMDKNLSPNYGGKESTQPGLPH